MTYRLYFNRCEDWPQVWSIDCGDPSTECNVVAWRTDGRIEMTSGRVDAPNAPIDKQRHPLAWCEVEARCVTIENGVAVFKDYSE